MTKPNKARAELSYRLGTYLSKTQRLYPDAFRNIDEAHLAQREQALWPQWCYTPMTQVMDALLTEVAKHKEVMALPETTLKLALMLQSAILTALATWRLGRDVVEFDPDLLAALWETPVTGQIPADILRRLPVWGLYLVAPSGKELFGKPLYGAFVHLESDPRYNHTELRLLLDMGDTDDMVALPLPLVGTLEDGIRKLLTSVSDKQETVQEFRALIEPFISLLLYICSRDAEWGSDKPQHAGAREIKRARHNSHAQARVWVLGQGLGQLLRREREAGEQQEKRFTANGRTSPRAHLRRGHWQTVWVGPRDKQTSDARWIRPLFVNGHFGEDGTIKIQRVK